MWKSFWKKKLISLQEDVTRVLLCKRPIPLFPTLFHLRIFLSSNHKENWKKKFPPFPKKIHWQREKTRIKAQKTFSPFSIFFEKMNEQGILFKHTHEFFFDVIPTLTVSQLEQKKPLFFSIYNDQAFGIQAWQALRYPPWLISPALFHSLFWLPPFFCFHRKHSLRNLPPILFLLSLCATFSPPSSLLFFFSLFEGHGSLLFFGGGFFVKKGGGIWGKKEGFFSLFFGTDVHWLWSDCDLVHPPRVSFFLGGEGWRGRF